MENKLEIMTRLNLIFFSENITLDLSFVQLHILCSDHLIYYSKGPAVYLFQE